MSDLERRDPRSGQNDSLGQYDYHQGDSALRSEGYNQVNYRDTQGMQQQPGYFDRDYNRYPDLHAEGWTKDGRPVIKVRQGEVKYVEDDLRAVIINDGGRVEIIKDADPYQQQRVFMPRNADGRYNVPYYDERQLYRPGYSNAVAVNDEFGREQLTILSRTNNVRDRYTAYHEVDPRTYDRYRAQNAYPPAGRAVYHSVGGVVESESDQSWRVTGPAGSAEQVNRNRVYREGNGGYNGGYEDVPTRGPVGRPPDGEKQQDYNFWMGIIGLGADIYRMERQHDRWEDYRNQRGRGGVYNNGGWNNGGWNNGGWNNGGRGGDCYPYPGNNGRVYPPGWHNNNNNNRNRNCR